MREIALKFSFELEQKEDQIQKIVTETKAENPEKKQIKNEVTNNGREVTLKLVIPEMETEKTEIKDFGTGALEIKKNVIKEEASAGIDTNPYGKLKVTRDYWDARYTTFAGMTVDFEKYSNVNFETLDIKKMTGNDIVNVFGRNIYDAVMRNRKCN